MGKTHQREKIRYFATMKAQILGFVGLILVLTNQIEAATWTTQSYSKFAQKYESTSAQCKAESAFPFFTSSTCERECFKCHAAVVIVIQLGCDVIHEIQPITTAVISVLRQFEDLDLPPLLNFDWFKIY